jgi:hypothetical protein
MSFEWINDDNNYRQVFYPKFKKLPIILVGGYHNAQFNVTWYRTKNSLIDEYNYYWTYDQGTPICFCW